MKGFTIDYFGDNFKNDPLLLKCIERSKEIFGKENFKIYTPEDELVKEAIEKYKFIFDKYLVNANYPVNLICDFIRLYILSKSEDTLYVDSDVYILDNELPKEKFYTPIFNLGCFNIIYSGFINHSEAFEKILDAMCKEAEKSERVLIDYEIIGKYKELFVQKEIIKNVHFISGVFLEDKITIIINSTDGNKISQFLNLKILERDRFRVIYNSDNVIPVRAAWKFLNAKNIVSSEWLYEYATSTIKRFKKRDKKSVRMVKL